MTDSYRSRRIVRSTSSLGIRVEPQRAVQDVAPAAGLDRFVANSRMKRRSTELVEAMRMIDTTVDESAREQVMSWVREHYEARQGGTIVGMFQRCYLGAPYVDHKLDLVGNIVHHYAGSETVEFPYSQARGLVRSDAYAFVEIYSDGTLVPVRPDGTAIRMPG